MRGATVLCVTLALAAAVSSYETQCPAEQEYDWEIEQLLRHEDCNKFYKCTFGKPVEMKCPNDLYFNLDTWECDWQNNVDCTDRNIPDLTTPEPTSTTTTEPTTTTTTTTTTTEPPTTTTTTTTTTEPPTTTTTTTTEPPTTTTTSTTTTTTPRPTTTTGQPGFLPNGCPVNPHIHWLLPHEENCTQFYYCVWGEKVLRDCALGTHFNRVIQVCDWPQDAGCLALNKHAANRRVMLDRAYGN